MSPKGYRVSTPGRIVLTTVYWIASVAVHSKKPVCCCSTTPSEARLYVLSFFRPNAPSFIHSVVSRAIACLLDSLSC